MLKKSCLFFIVKQSMNTWPYPANLWVGLWPSLKSWSLMDCTLFCPFQSHRFAVHLTLQARNAEAFALLFLLVLSFCPQMWIWFFSFFFKFLCVTPVTYVTYVVPFVLIVHIFIWHIFLMYVFCLSHWKYRKWSVTTKILFCSFLLSIMVLWIFLS